jgi:hypothetical protein
MKIPAFKLNVATWLLVSVAATFAVGCSDDDTISKYGDAGSATGGVDAAVTDSAVNDASVVLLVDAPVDMAVAAPADAAPADAQTAFVKVFTASLDETLPPSVTPGDCKLTPSQGYEPLGPEGNKFGPTFLRCTTTNTFTLTLENLPTHTSLDIEFLFAAIDSLDGTGSFPAGDFFSVYVDNVVIFKESFANADASQIQSYMPPAGVTLARRVDLGFQGPGGYYTDSAYNMGADPTFKNIPHVGSKAVLKFTLEGGGVQGLNDESWAIDNLRVTTGNTPRPAAVDAGAPDAN